MFFDSSHLLCLHLSYCQSQFSWIYVTGSYQQHKQSLQLPLSLCSFPITVDLDLCDMCSTAPAC